MGLISLEENKLSIYVSCFVVFFSRFFSCCVIMITFFPKPMSSYNLLVKPYHSVKMSAELWVHFFIYTHEFSKIYYVHNLTLFAKS